LTVFQRGFKLPQLVDNTNFETKKQIFAEELLNWHQSNKRNFAWRVAQDPYEILVAEIMLQKTDASKVEKVYSNFIKKYPDPYTLANSDVLDIRKDINLLGIHQRAERLKKMAETLIDKFNGKVPDTKPELMELFGVGEYISNAVLCFAYEKDVPLLDTNIIRVLERIFSIKSEKIRPRTDKKLWQIMESIIPSGKAKEFNVALLDFSAKICTAKNPKHIQCPLGHICNYYTNLINKENVQFKN
jgi:A/G-specific adenine glycosylase